MGRIYLGPVVGLLLVLCACHGLPSSAMPAARSAEIFLAGPTPAPTTSGQEVPAGLAGYIKQGLQGNPGLRAAFARWQGAHAKAATGGYLPEPRLTWAHFIDELETRTGPQRNRFSLMQTFPWPGKLGLQEEILAREAQALWWQVKAQRDRLIKGIRQAYYEYAYLARALKISRDSLQLLRGLEPVVQIRLQAGGAQADLVRLQLEIGKVENRVASLAARRSVLSFRLGSLLNRRDKRPLPWPQESKFALAKIDGDRYREQILHANPEMLAAGEQVARAEKKRQLAALAGRPSFTLGATLFETGPARMAGVDGSGDDPFALSLSMSLPIWVNKYRAEEVAAEAGEGAARQALRQRGNRLLADLESCLFKLDDAARQARLIEKTLLPRADQALALTRRAYQAGKMGMLDLVDRQQMLLSLQLARVRARVDHKINHATLIALSGGE